MKKQTVAAVLLIVSALICASCSQRLIRIPMTQPSVYVYPEPMVKAGASKASPTITPAPAKTGTK
ncbi:MAG: hypothetical protein LLG37_03025 [Spirochaetia bacterium]|nr:hypothetical protein [Spirochaetia bacterium]